MPAEQWFYRLDGKPHGPFTVAQFEKLIRGKTVTAETEVSRDGNAWQTLLLAVSGVPVEKPVEPPVSSLEWMNAPTLIPGEVRLPPGWKDGLKGDKPS